MGTCTSVKLLSPSKICLKATRSFRVAAVPSILTEDEAVPAYSTLNEVIDTPLGFIDDIRSTTDDNGGNADDEIDVTSDCAEVRFAAMTEVSVPMLLSAIWACAPVVFSAILEMRYDGKRKTEEISMVRETKKRKTIKNLIRYSVLRSLTAG